ARLMFENTEVGYLKLSNALGVNIRELVVLDEDNRYYQLTGTLANAGEITIAPLEGQLDWKSPMGRQCRAFLKNMEPGTYLALVDGMIAGQLGLDDVEIRGEECRFVIIGYWEAEP
ncbi:hypothetical protein ACFL54_09885, partial [Planctomycetota bacterium]